MRELNLRHFQKFHEFKSQATKWRGFNVHAWAVQVTGEHWGQLRDVGAVDRTGLREICATASPEVVFLAVMAWGGKNRDHARACWNHSLRGELMEAIAELPRFESLGDAYERFATLRARGLPGLGPAYYTKLIHFAAPQLSGYMMDQWLARSINLLYGPVIHLNGTHVSDRNSRDVYEEFCLLVDALAKRSKDIGEQTEQALFSEGRGRGLWRNYLIAAEAA